MMKTLTRLKSNFCNSDFRRNFDSDCKQRVLWERSDQNPDLVINAKKEKLKIHKELFKTPEPLVPIEENLFYPEFNFDITNQS